MMSSLLWVACYSSHFNGDENADAGSSDATVDARSFDVPTFDVPAIDAPTPIDVPVMDAPRDSGFDASIQCRIQLIDQARVEWPLMGCGNITFPRVTPLLGADGAFQLLITENQSCAGRTPQLLTRPATFDGESLRVGSVESLGAVEGPGSIASIGTEFAVCSGTTLFAQSPTEPLQPPCMTDALCAGLAFDGEGWGVGWRPGCEAPTEISRAEVDGGRREAPITLDFQDSIASVAPSSTSFGALSVGPRSLWLSLWPRAAPGPTYLPVSDARPDSGLAALAPWPFIPGAWVAYSIEDSRIHLRVLNAVGDVRLDVSHPIAIEGYGPAYLRASSGTETAAAVISYSWQGGRIDAGTRLMVFGPTGFPVGDGDVVDLNLEQDLGGADVAVNGRSILVHRASPDNTATDILLYRCD